MKAMNSKKLFSFSFTILSFIISGVTLSSLTTGCSIVQNNKSLSTAKAQKIVNTWNSEQTETIKVIGVRENQDNTAVATLQFSNFKFTSNVMPQSSPYSGSGEATFSYYTDGYWVMNRITITLPEEKSGITWWDTNTKENSGWGITIKREPIGAPTGNSILNNLVGTWKESDEDNSILKTMIFTSQGELLIPSLVLGVGRSETDFVKIPYQINPLSQPKHIDIFVNFSDKNQIMGIFDFNSHGDLLLEVNVDSRPTTFSSRPNALQKISDATVLPSGSKLLTEEEIQAEVKEMANQAKQSEAKQYLSSMSKGQQAFYMENSFFVSRLEDLGIGLKSETENYSYSLIEIDKKQLVQMVALSKRDELRTYTVIVGLQGTSGNYSSISILCRSDQPTRDFPPRHKDANSCPPGYSEVGK
ncbi:MAG TPA: type IV pilin-like G/H family protein [Candidatus Obscuribacterales bacterium]